MFTKLFKKLDKLMKASRFDKVANKYLAALIIFLTLPSAVFAEEVKVTNIDHTTVMTKDAMIILDKRAGKFWKTEFNCSLPINANSKVSFKTVHRTIKEGSEITFIIGDLKKDNQHNCKVLRLASL